jgi:hypothetical protein
MDENNIFVPHYVNLEDDISGKITYTSIIESIPNTNVSEPLDNWRDKYNIEWRWRFIEVNDRLVGEISYLTSDSNERMYFNRYGKWVHRKISSVYDKYVKEKYYYYTN